MCFDCYFSIFTRKINIMSLKTEQITKNAAKFFKTAQDYGFMNDELMNFLGQDFIKAPASTNKNLHNAFEGGLIDHLLRVTKHAVSLNETILPEELRIDKKSIVKVGLLHQIGKAHLYTKCTSEWHITNQGKMYEFNDKLTSMSVAERSIYYLLSYGINLSEDEFQAIINHDKDDSDKQAKYHTNTLGEILKIAIKFAIMEEKK